MAERKYLKGGDPLRAGEILLVVFEDQKSDLMEFILVHPADEDVVFVDPQTGQESPVKWEDGLPYIEL